MRRLHVLLLALLLSACAAVSHPPGPPVVTPAIAPDHLLMADGARLPLRQWMPAGPPKAVIVALHGMNDYSNFFDEPGTYLAGLGIASYAYDQRGFGQGPHPGTWSSTEAMADDSATAIRLMAAKHPGVPVFALGESMGGAVLMVMEAQGRTPAEMTAKLLSAPAVWGRAAMPWYQRAVLWLAYHVAPGWKPSGRGLNIRPSDNIEMLKKLGADPLVIKETRVDAIKGVVDLMDRAAELAPTVTGPTLVLYGEKDEVIPAEPTWRAIRALPGLETEQRVALYGQGWHMLLRDLQAKVVLDDIAAWVADRAAPLPSGADSRARAKLSDR
ncbi:alpha/beta hydrolase [Magnetospirillum moscoviense]|uniref:Alpha/beta hydrolase n=1 Tax=Magnetospirillum moscoviense TaxID=1437059 RepID=A0A178N019_9PROT|nr:alpha/beta hydrolase [Magnetospirillum moscoviense]OAN56855.1 alpha/beta hydrolase [Magnetospirillum moscoviense]